MFFRLPPSHFHWWISHYCIMIALFTFGITNLLYLFFNMFFFLLEKKSL